MHMHPCPKSTHGSTSLDAGNNAEKSSHTRPPATSAPMALTLVPNNWSHCQSSSSDCDLPADAAVAPSSPSTVWRRVRPQLIISQAAWIKQLAIDQFSQPRRQACAVDTQSAATVDLASGIADTRMNQKGSHGKSSIASATSEPASQRTSRRALTTSASPKRVRMSSVSTRSRASSSSRRTVPAGRSILRRKMMSGEKKRSQTGAIQMVSQTISPAVQGALPSAS
mmetsp:Transcript_6710/g.20311  ORF Transcript_6710/g.20311 Transcript_6710/m.20311 type:complete len:225 (+) Transcript_6710:2556-3230(+)